MLDLMLRYVNARNLIMAGLALALMPFAVRLARISYVSAMRKAYPPARDSGPAGDEIRRLLDQREEEKVQAQCRRLRQLLEEAKQLGYGVGGLEWNLSEAMSRDVPGRRTQTLQLLRELEMAVPRKKVQYIPLYERVEDDTMTDDEVAPAKGAATKSRARRRGKPAKKTTRGKPKVRT